MCIVRDWREFPVGLLLLLATVVVTAAEVPPWNDMDMAPRGEECHQHNATTPFCQSINPVLVLQDCAKGPYQQANSLRQQLEKLFGSHYMCYSLAYGYLTIEDLQDYDLIVVDGSSAPDFAVVSEWLGDTTKKDNGHQFPNLLQAYVDRGHIVWFNAAVPSEEDRVHTTPWKLPYGAVLQPGMATTTTTNSHVQHTSTADNDGNDTMMSHGWIALPTENKDDDGFETLWVNNDHDNNPILVRRKDLSFWAGTLAPFATQKRCQVLQWLCQAVAFQRSIRYGNSVARKVSDMI